MLAAWGLAALWLHFLCISHTGALLFSSAGYSQKVPRAVPQRRAATGIGGCAALAHTERSSGSPARSGGSSRDKGTDQQKRGGGPSERQPAPEGSGRRLQPGGRLPCASDARGSNSESRRRSEAG